MQQHESLSSSESEAKIALNLKSSCCNDIPHEAKGSRENYLSTTQSCRKTADPINSERIFTVLFASKIVPR